MVNKTGYQGCCGSDILYGFTSDPNAPAEYEYEIVQGRFGTERRIKYVNGAPVTSKNVEKQFRDTVETFNPYTSGGRMISCILTESQLAGVGKKWLTILKEEGFEFVRRWTNGGHQDNHYLYLFVKIVDPKNRCHGDFTVPPSGWNEVKVKAAAVTGKD